MPFGRKSAKPRPMLNEAGLFDYAVKALGRRMRTEAELRRLMKMRVEPDGHGEAAITAVVARLKAKETPSLCTLVQLMLEPW